MKSTQSMFPLFAAVLLSFESAVAQAEDAPLTEETADAKSSEAVLLLESDLPNTVGSTVDAKTEHPDDVRKASYQKTDDLLTEESTSDAKEELPHSEVSTSTAKEELPNAVESTPKVQKPASNAKSKVVSNVDQTEACAKADDSSEKSSVQAAADAQSSADSSVRTVDDVQITIDPFSPDAIAKALKGETSASPAVVEEDPTPKPFCISLYHVNTKEKLNNLKLLEQDPDHPERIWIPADARKQINHLFRDWRKGSESVIEERLIWSIYEVAQKYQMPLNVVSVFRITDGPTSRHRQGRAIDFRIDGIANKDLWEDCKQFDHMGVGYYPNVDFIHIDTREKHYYWIDISGSGQPSVYLKNVSQKQPFKHRTLKVKAGDHSELKAKVAAYAAEQRAAYAQKKGKNGKRKASEEAYDASSSVQTVPNAAQSTQEGSSTKKGSTSSSKAKASTGAKTSSKGKTKASNASQKAKSSTK